jgi:isopentenyl phosphate kinase
MVTYGTLPVLHGDVWVDALIAQIVDIGAQILVWLLHVVEGGGEIRLEDVEALLHRI